MPRDAEGPFDILFNPFGIQGRKNLGQIYEMYVGEAAYRMNKKFRELIDAGKKQEALNVILKTYTVFGQEKIGKELVARLRKEEVLREAYENGIPIFVPPGTRPDISKIRALMKLWNVPEETEIFYPDMGFSIKVPAGRIYVGRLEHRVKEKFGERATGRYDRYGQAIRGGKKEGGQRADEFGSWALFGHAIPELVLEMYGPLADDHETKQMLIEEIKENGEASLEGKPIKFPTSNILKAYLLGLGVLDV
jgi:DNA-directed RNA polymerase subunit beta